MTDDDRGPFEPGNIDSQADEAGDPAQAFEALRHTIETQGTQIGAEMTVIRRGVEAAFEQFEKFQQPADYSADLGQIVQQLAYVGEHLEALEQSPILKNGPEHYARALERSGESLVKTAAQQFQNDSRDLQGVAHELTAYTKSAYDRKSQDFRMWIAVIVGVIVGIFLAVLLPRILPFAADTHIAAIVMGQDRWNAGVTMMQTADPSGWRSVVDSSQLVRDNVEAISQCVETARTVGEDQRCEIMVKTSAQ